MKWTTLLEIQEYSLTLSAEMHEYAAPLGVETQTIKSEERN